MDERMVEGSGRMGVAGEAKAEEEAEGLKGVEVEAGKADDAIEAR